MKYKKWFLGLVWGMVVFQAAVMGTAKNDHKLIEAFEASNTIPIDGKVMVSGSLGDKKLSDQTKRNLLIRLAGQTKITKGYTIKKTKEDGVSTMTLEKKNGSSGLWFRISSSGNNNYLMTEVAIEDIKEVLVLKNQLEEIMEKNGIRTQSSLYLHGNFKKVLSRKEKNAMEERLMKVLEAKKVLSYKDEYSDTIYGYSSVLSDYYERKGKKINFQMILNYNESGKNTQLYLAVPFYNESY